MGVHNDVLTQSEAHVPSLSYLSFFIDSAISIAIIIN